MKIRTYFKKLSQDEVLSMASALAFSIFTSIIPIIAIAYFIFALLGGFEELRVAVFQYAFQYIAPSLADDLSRYIASIENKVSPSTLGIFGLVWFLYAGLSMIGQAEWSLNKMWGALEPRTFLQRLSRYTSAIILGPILLGASIAMTSFLAVKVEELQYFSGVFLFLLTWLPYLFTSILFCGIYYYLPNTQVDKRAAIIAGCVTGLSFELLKQGFAFYASIALKNSIYGSLAAIPIMVFWIYLVAIVFLAGGELCYFIDQRRNGIFHFAPETSLLSMPLLRDIVTIYCDPKENDRLGVDAIVQRLKWDQSVVLKHVHFLVKSKILKHAENFHRREECFEAVEKNLAENLARVALALNKVRYEQVQIPKLQPQTSAQSQYLGAPLESH